MQQDDRGQQSGGYGRFPGQSDHQGSTGFATPAGRAVRQRTSAGSRAQGTTGSRQAVQSRGTSQIHAQAVPYQTGSRSAAADQHGSETFVPAFDPFGTPASSRMGPDIQLDSPFFEGADLPAVQEDPPDRFQPAQPVRASRNATGERPATGTGTAAQVPTEETEQTTGEPQEHPQLTQIRSLKDLIEWARPHAVTVVLVAVAVAIVAVMGVFAEKKVNTLDLGTVSVTGLRFRTREDVLLQTGLKDGMYVGDIDLNEVWTGIDNSRYFICRSVGYDEKGQLAIRVYERAVSVLLNCNAEYFLMDNKGMLLEYVADPELYGDLPEVNGVRPYSRCREGRVLVTENAEQKEALCALLLEMTVLECADEIRSINMYDTADIIVNTRLGFSVRMGSGESFFAKLKAMLSVQDYLIGQGETGGTINVSNPEEPTFIRPTV